MPLGFGGGGTTVYFANQICRIVRRAYEHPEVPGSRRGITLRCSSHPVPSHLPMPVQIEYYSTSESIECLSPPLVGNSTTVPVTVVVTANGRATTASCSTYC